MKTRHLTSINYWIIIILLSILILFSLLLFGKEELWHQTPAIHILNFLTCLSALVTILGIVTIYSIYTERKISNESLEHVLEDFIRHLWCNNALLEIFRYKMSVFGTDVFPEKGFFLRFAFMDNDLNFSRFVKSGKTFDKVHRIEMKMRNYNIATSVAADYFADPSTTDEMKKKSLNYLINRSLKLIKNFQETAPLIIGKSLRPINEIIISRYAQEIKDMENRGESTPSITPLDRSHDPLRCAFDSTEGMKEIMDNYIKAYYQLFDVFPFNKEAK